MRPRAALRVFAVVAVGQALLMPGCKRGVGGPTPLPNTYPVTFVAFLDENGNKTPDGNEVTRLPNAEVVAGGAKGRTATLTGQVTIQVPQGAQTLEVTAGSLPPFYRPPASSTINVPSTSMVMVPITLPLGPSNRPNVYMAFGDSITNGEPDIGDGNGYRLLLQSKLRAHFGSGTVANEGVDSTRSNDGASRIGVSLARVHPAFTLILYGTNDWNDSACNDLPCYTTEAFRSMIRQINRDGGHAFVGTILPVNVGYDDRVPPYRNDWVAQQNALMRQVADEEGAVVVDLNGAFLRSGLIGSALYRDHIHPQAAGYEIMAQTWFDAISRAYSKALF